MCVLRGLHIRILDTGDHSEMLPQRGEQTQRGKSASTNITGQIPYVQDNILGVVPQNFAEEMNVKPKYSSRD